MYTPHIYYIFVRIYATCILHIQICIHVHIIKMYVYATYILRIKIYTLIFVKKKNLGKKNARCQFSSSIILSCCCAYVAVCEGGGRGEGKGRGGGGACGQVHIMDACSWGLVCGIGFEV
jgi:hypothetical protein